jgi:deoxyadenosine/deoxycytidine kinase
MRHKLIAFIGVPGSGKTTAANILAKSGFSLSEENFSGNSFLSKYYEEMARWAFHSQMYFLINKIKQSEEINNSLKWSCCSGLSALSGCSVCTNHIQTR